MKCSRVKGSAILTTIFLLFGILTVAMIGLEVIMSGLASRRAQGSSAQAFWAAETGIERATMAFKSFNVYNNSLFDKCSSSSDWQYLKFCNSLDCENTDANLGCLTITDPNNKNAYHLNGNPTLPSYWVKVKTSGRDVELISQGNFLTTSRQIYVKFCLPSCTANGFPKSSGEADGCGGTCK